jgi:hypothetical protein
MATPGRQASAQYRYPQGKASAQACGSCRAAKWPRVHPCAGLEFEKGWNACKGDPSLQADYLQLVPAAKLPAILKQALAPALLAAVLRALLGPGAQRAPAHCVAVLEALPDVPRWARQAVLWFPWCPHLLLV